MLREVYPLNAISVSGENLMINVHIAKKAKMLIGPNTEMIKSTRYEENFPAVDFDTYIFKYSLENQRYVGTIKSITSDALLDIYLITVDTPINSKVSDPNDSTKLLDATEIKTETFFIVIPSLLMLPDADTGATPPYIDVDAIVFGVTAYDNKTSSLGMSDVNELKDTTAYLPNNLVLDKPDGITIYTLALDGIATDSKFNQIEIYTTGGQLDSNETMPTQMIDLGLVNDLFKTYFINTSSNALTLHTASVQSIGINKYHFTTENKNEITGGRLVLAINF